MWVAITAIISVMGSILVAAGTLYFTKKAERDAVWHSKKLAYYEEFIEAATGVTGDKRTAEAHARFATSANNLNLVGSNDVIVALQKFLDEAKVSNTNKTKTKHDLLFSALVWHIRNDLKDPPTKNLSEFSAKLTGR